jgi:MFS transporter, ACS family, D-galactonate transporter
MIAGVILAIGIVSFVFVMGRIEAIPEPEQQGARDRASVA